MARGESKFKVGDTIDTTTSGNDRPGELDAPESGSFKNTDESMAVKGWKPNYGSVGAGLLAGVVGGDIANRIQDRRNREFKDELLNKLERNNKMRGSNSFKVMKGFTEVEDVKSVMSGDGGGPKGKSGQSDESFTMAENLNMVGSKAKGDIADSYVSDSQDLHTDADIGRGDKNKTENRKGNPTTMSENVSEVAAGAKKDIADSYVSDIQKEKPAEKGFEIYNQMVEKGFVADVEFKRGNTEAMIGELESRIDTKGPYRDVFGAGAKGARKLVREAAENAKPLNRIKTAVGNIGRLGKNVAGKAGKAIVDTASNPLVAAGGGAALGVGGTIAANRAYKKRKEAMAKGFDEGGIEVKGPYKDVFGAGAKGARKLVREAAENAKPLNRIKTAVGNVGRLGKQLVGEAASNPAVTGAAGLAAGAGGMAAYNKHKKEKGFEEKCATLDATKAGTMAKKMGMKKKGVEEE